MIEWGRVGYDELLSQGFVLSAEAEVCFIIYLYLQTFLLNINSFYA